MPIDPKAEELYLANQKQQQDSQPGIGAQISQALSGFDQPLVNRMPSVKSSIEKLFQPSAASAPQAKTVNGTATVDEGDRTGITGMLKDAYHHPGAFLGGAVEGATKPTTLANAVSLGGMVGASRAALEAPELLSAGKTLGIFGKAPGAVTDALKAVPALPAPLGRAAGAVNAVTGVQQATDPHATTSQEIMGGANALLGGAEMAYPTGFAPIAHTGAAAPVKPIFNTPEEFLQAAESEKGIGPQEWAFIKAKQAEDLAQQKVTSQKGPWNDAVDRYKANIEPRAKLAEAQYHLSGDSVFNDVADRIRKQAVDGGVAGTSTSNQIISKAKAAINQEAKNRHAAEKATLTQHAAADDIVATANKQEAQGWNQEAKNLNAGEKAQANLDAQKAIEQQKLEQQLTAQPPQISETTAVRNGPVTERMSTRFTPPAPEEPEGGDLGGGGGAPTGGPTPSGTPADPLARTIFSSRDKALRAEKGAGAFDSVKNPEGPGWIHVFPTPKPSGPSTFYAKDLDPNQITDITPPVPEAPPVAPPVDDLADIKAVATPPQEDFSDIEAVAQPPAVQPKFTSDKALNPVSDRDIQALDDKLGGPDVATPGNGLSPAEPPAPAVLPKLKSTKAPKGKKPVVEPVPAVENQVPNEAPIDALHPNLTKSAPSEDINDVDLATGVTTTKPIKVPTTAFKTPEEAGAAATKLGLPEHSIDQFKGSGFRIVPTKPPFENALGPDTGPDVGFHKPEGVVLENTQGKWNRAEFKTKGEEAPQAVPASPETPAAAAPPPEPAPTTEAVTPTQVVEPKTQAAAIAPTGPKGSFRVAAKLKKKGVEELPQEELDKLSPDAREAYFKKTDPMLSANFPFRHNIKFNDPQVAADWKKLAQDAPRMNRKDVYSQLKSLYARNRGANAAQDKADDFPEIGSQRWHDFIDKFADPQSPTSAEVGAAENEGMPPRNSEAGFTNMGLLGRAALGAYGAGVGGQEDPVGHITGGHHPYLSAALVGTGMVALPDVLHELPSSMGRYQEKFGTLGANLNAAHNTGLLSPLSVLKKGLADVGGLTSAAVENPARAGNIIHNLLSPDSWRQAYQAGKAGVKSGASEDLTGTEQLLNKTPLSWAGKVMGGLTGGTKDILDRSGFNPLEQGYYTMTSKPITKTGGTLYDFINSNNIMKNIAPFARIGINRIERGIERSPLGAVNLMRKGANPKDIGIKAALGSGVADAAYQATPEDFVKKHPVASGLMSAAAGPYGLPVALAMAAKTRKKSGGFTEATKTLERDVPGAEALKYLESPNDFLSTYLAGYTNAAKPIADLVQPEDKVIKTAPHYNMLQNATYGALSNIPGVRGKLPHHTISTKPLSQQEIDMLNELLGQGNK